MKKSLSSLLFVMFSALLLAQSITLSDPFNGGVVVNDDTIDFRGYPVDYVIEQDVFVAHNQISNVSINVKRYETEFVSGMDNYFCWAVCYPAVANGDSLLWDAPSARTVNSGATDKNFHAYLKPNGYLGTNIYQYVFYDFNNNNDSATVWIRFKVYKPGDLNENGTYEAGEIAGDLDFNGVIDNEEIAGDTDGSGIIDSAELTGDIDGDGVINNGELLGDKNGDKILQASETSTGIKNNEFNSSLTIFPNPANNAVFISAEATIGTIRIHNILGSLMYTQNVTGKNATVDVSNWSKGVYFISNESNRTQRIIVN